jgi:curli biogenesis system outer membrane secretion channel CsgG
MLRHFCARFAAAIATVVLLPMLSLFIGCGSHSTESAEGDKLTAHVATYDPPPPNAYRPRVGVPPFSVQGSGGFNGNDVNALAADQMSTLLDQSGRFRVIERTQLTKLLDEQDLEGIVKAGELARPGQVRGVDYLMIGRVTNLRVKAEQSSKGLGVGQITGGLVNLGGFDYKDKSKKITTECGVDIRLVDPTTAEVMTSSFSEYKRTDSIRAFGVDILGASATADADLQVEEDDKGKILRLALDDAVRKSLPKIDRFLASHPGEPHPSAAAAIPAAPAPRNSAVAPAESTPAAVAPAVPAAAKRFCSECGKPMAAGVKFCPECGAKQQ